MQDIDRITPRDRVVRELALHEISPTRQRVEIGMSLLGRDRHVTAEQLLEELNGTVNTTVSKATVYNTLGLFASKGLLREVFIDPSRVIYDTNVSAHHHVFNVDTGELNDLPNEVVEVALKTKLPEGLCVEGVDVIVRVKNISS